ncbi:thioredoxin family protein [Luminiphilus syltensis NOR5-1B]|uniref:Thioredoxin family protein n=1 Tax=Luminiphilus syltensis NOR5-1B TaxID=565045 RepID=B8KSE6_9GAMM|nr:TlpA disulfide reductase family protein [Luminiphilus syltensis]EED35261.1 thioredoxin family protein [Luminiphilus syltensis NOR5-1B]
MNPFFCSIAIAVVTLILAAPVSLADGVDEADRPVLPLFELPTLTNSSATTIGSEDLSGKVVYIDFWASWCGPCRLSLPALDALYRELKDQGFEALAISVDVVEEDALDFFERYPISYPAVIDKSGDVAKRFAVNGMPSGYLVDRDGRVVSVHVGFRRGDEAALREEILGVLATPPSKH